MPLVQLPALIKVEGGRWFYTEFLDNQLETELQ